MIILLSGVPGAGKSLNLIKKYIVPALQQGRNVWTNLEGLKTLPLAIYSGVDLIQIEKLLKITSIFDSSILSSTFRENELIIIDEAQHFWNNRDFKSQENKDVLSFLQVHRHHGLDIVFATQNIDQLDIGIRRLCGVHYRLSKMSNIGLHSRVRVNVFPDAMGSEQFLPLTVENWSIDKNIFKLYDSYKSPVIVENKAGSSVFKNPKLIFTVCVLLFAITYYVKKFVVDGDSLIMPSLNKNVALEQATPLKTDSSKIWIEAWSPDGRNVFILFSDSTKERHILKNFPVNQLIKNEGKK